MILDILNFIFFCVGLVLIVNSTKVFYSLKKFVDTLTTLPDIASMFAVETHLPTEELKRGYRIFLYASISVLLTILNSFNHYLYILPVGLYIIMVGYSVFKLNDDRPKLLTTAVALCTLLAWVGFGVHGLSLIYKLIW